MIATFIPTNFKGEPFLGTRLYVSFYATISLGSKQTVSGHGLGFIMHLRLRQFVYICSLLKAEKA